VHSNELLRRFLALLDQAGVDPAAPSPDDVPRSWDAMRVLAAEPVEDAGPRDEDGDGLLAQYGSYGLWTPKRFQLDITRQLTFYEGDEYAGMAQLHCTFEYELTDELMAVGEKSFWSFGMELDDFFEQALALPGFAAVQQARLTPIRLDVDYGDV
jgi:hypothetical protein